MINHTNETITFEPRFSKAPNRPRGSQQTKGSIPTKATTATTRPRLPSEQDNKQTKATFRPRRPRQQTDQGYFPTKATKQTKATNRPRLLSDQGNKADQGYKQTSAKFIRRPISHRLLNRPLHMPKTSTTAHFSPSLQPATPMPKISTTAHFSPSSQPATLYAENFNDGPFFTVFLTGHSICRNFSRRPILHRLQRSWA
jgi:hypothetical protein